MKKISTVFLGLSLAALLILTIGCAPKATVKEEAAPVVEETTAVTANEAMVTPSATEVAPVETAKTVKK